MIKNLRFRFIKIMMMSLFVVLFVIIGSMNVVFNLRNHYIADKKLEWIAASETMMPGFNIIPELDNNMFKPPIQREEPGFRIDAETPFRLRYFSAFYANDGEVVLDMSHIASLSEAEARKYTDKIYESEKIKGYYKDYRYLAEDRENGKIIIFLDCSEEKYNGIVLLLTTVMISAAGFFAVLVLVVIISGKVIQPVIKNIERQKRFVTDAGHEIKTPLAIIAANAEVLEITYGEDPGAKEWLGSITHQIERLNTLVHSMLRLSKMDEENVILKEEDFSLSEAVESTALSFSPLVKSKNKSLRMKVADGIFIKGDENNIRELVTILIDNAVKYSSEDSEISVTLGKRGKGGIIEVENRCDNFSREELEKLFERFYRTDSSRSSENSGYGLGLSIAKAVVEAHKGTIDVSLNNENEIKFTVIL